MVTEITDGNISRGPVDGVRETMSARLQRNWALNLLAIASIKQRRALLETISVQQLKTLLEVIYNVIPNRAVIPSETFIKSLYKYRHVLRQLAKKGAHKKALLRRRHGFLPVLLKPLLPELSKYVH